MLKGSPQRRLTSAFDLEKSRWEPRLRLIVFGYKPDILPPEHHDSLLQQGIDHKTLLAVTNVAVNLHHCSELNSNSGNVETRKLIKF